MNIQRRLLAALAVLAITFGLDGLVYGNLLKDYFSSSCNKPMPDMIWLVLGLLFYAYMFCFMYQKINWSGTRTGSGLRYGIWVFLLMFVPFGLIYYSTSNCASLNQIMVDLGYRFVATLLIGIIAAHILKHPLAEKEGLSGPVVEADPD